MLCLEGDCQASAIEYDAHAIRSDVLPIKEAPEFDFDAKADEAGQAKFVAKQMIKVEMTKRNLGYRELSAALGELGVEVEEKVLRNKVARGTFSAAFLVTCMMAMQVKTIDLSPWTKSMEDIIADIRRIIREDDPATTAMLDDLEK
jgi:hypothetical protein